MPNSRLVIQESLQNTLWIPHVLRNPDQLDDIFLPKLVKLQQLRGKGLAPQGWGGVQLRAQEKLPKALGDLSLCPPCPFAPDVGASPASQYGAKRLWVSGQALVGFSFFSCNFAKEEVELEGKDWGQGDSQRQPRVSEWFRCFQTL